MRTAALWPRNNPRKTNHQAALDFPEAPDSLKAEREGDRAGDRGHEGQGMRERNMELEAKNEG